MSANTGVITYGGLGNEVMQFYNSVASLQNLYCFLSSVDPWSTETSPPAPSLDQQTLKNVYKNMFVMKRVYSVDVSPLTDRIDWAANTVYDYYQDSVDMLQRDMNDYKVLKFYVKNQYDQVFKCLWNNNGVPSTSEPFFEPGYLQTNKVYLGTDGYKWVYMYTIEAGIKQKFLDTNWIPTPIANTPGIGTSYQFNPPPVNAGNILVVNVTNGGSGYTVTDTVVSINGSNTSTALVTPIIVNGSITDIQVANTGAGYISANVVISSANGHGAVAFAPVSPPGGHGTDPFLELGACHVMVTTTFDNTENGFIPTDIDYRQLGFISNPVTISSYPYPANSTIYNLSTRMVLSIGTDHYQTDEIVYQGSDVANSYFSGTCLSWDASNNVLSVINTQGTPKPNQTVHGSISGGNRPLYTYSNPDFIPYSGYITYLENREGTVRSPDGSEQVRLLIGF